MKKENEKYLFQKRLTKMFGIDNKEFIRQFIEDNYVHGETDKSNERFALMLQGVRKQL